ncbi:HIRAN domain-containing protein [Tenggerimyces flavus]|uniref:HIRAN domain-containing protein n=1 Tax=Tenggerimyces flavus TaxID=1708749 RepID=A0ABV7YA86_9ACTN|nr:HIRAN domain-containing protein [Tenggerimyces flavus]MBM7783735.1 hypothetical protein [Tenggerimyces flavus]
MALLERLRRWRTQQSSPPSMAKFYWGEESLEVVGESNYQDALWSLCGGVPGGERVRHAVVAVLVPEPENPYDENAISVRIESHRVGYLDRATAASYIGGLRALVSATRHHVALGGVIVGGGLRTDGLGLLGVWLDHNPSDFGVRRRAFDPAALRTGFSEAWLTDVDDDSYDLSWYDALPENDVDAIALLRDLLASDPDPIDRHFQFAELGSRLYRRRERDPSALHAYDVTCGQHDAEMESICAAFLEKWGKVPLLETYRQMAIRQQKRRDWPAVVWWTTRGLELYGAAAARSDSVEDLLKRRHQGLAKLDAAAAAQRPATRPPLVAVPSVDGSAPPADPTGGVSRPLETLTCTQCTTPFDRLVVRGRKPSLCPSCRLGRP